MINKIETLKQLQSDLNALKAARKQGDTHWYAIAHGYSVRINRLINSMENESISHHEDFDLLVNKTNQFIGQI
jgi:hypothetical protein